MSSTCEDALRPDKCPVIVSEAPNCGSKGIFTQSAEQPGPRRQEWGPGVPAGSQRGA